MMTSFLLICLSALATVTCLPSPAMRPESVGLQYPSSFDWRTHGVISPVHNQGQIGDSLDYAITEGVESLHAIQTRTKVMNLSVIELAECCDHRGHLTGSLGYECVKDIGGLCTAEDYVAGTGHCNNGSCQAVGKVTGSRNVPENREDLMLEAILKTPLTAYISAGHMSFQEYQSGVFDDPSCKEPLDHVVQVIGYGATSDSTPYWIIKNSWGVNWGEKGYMRIVRGKNMCGLATKVLFPINDNEEPHYQVV